MLGPIDIEDWSTSEEDVLRAEIRLLPAFRKFGRGGASLRLDAGLARRVRAFVSDAVLPCEDLRMLLADLEAAGHDGAGAPR
ncbi:MAG: hypothetical protein KGM42_06715 [Hyphomicrobiales bacterium]|nr:hypothetical protein [Hyphomicrobiales bacterium]